MPGLFGIVAKTPQTPPESLHAMGRRMADAMRSLPWLRAELWAGERFCGGRVDPGIANPGAQPLETTDGRARIWFDGECRLPGRSSRGTPAADAARSLVIGHPPAIVDADGVFNMAILNDAGQLLLATDRLGFRPLYYTETPHWFAYAAEVKALLAIRDGLPTVDEIAVRQYFGFDHMLGDRTWWQGIALIPPASVWCISGASTTTRRYWSFDDLRQEHCGQAEAQHLFGHLWEQSVREHHRQGTTPVLLSGGLDSRLLVAELVAQGADTVAVTYGSEESPEVGPARAVAAVAGITHRVCHWTTENWWHGREQGIWQTDGLVNANHLHPAIAVEEMRVGTRYSPMNVIGDLLFGGSHLDRAATGPPHAERAIAKRFVPNPFFSLDEVLESSRPDIVRYTEGPTSDCVHLRQRVRRYVLHSPGCFAPHCETVFPGVGVEFLQLFLGTLTDRDRAGHRFYNQFLASRHPRFFANLPWQTTGRGLCESIGVRIARDVKARVNRLLGIRRRKTASNRWFVDFPSAVRQHRIRERLLGQTLLVDDVLHGAARRALLKDSEQPLAAESVIAILSAETYFRQVTGMPRLTGAAGRSPDRSHAASASRDMATAYTAPSPLATAGSRSGGIA